MPKDNYDDMSTEDLVQELKNVQKQVDAARESMKDFFTDPKPTPTNGAGNLPVSVPASYNGKTVL
jgi:hypothetical protein